MDKNEVLKILPLLSVQELKQIRGAVDSQLKRGKKSKKSTSADERFYNIICDEFFKKRLSHFPSYYRFKKNPDFAYFKKNHKLLVEFEKEVFSSLGRSLNRREKDCLYRGFARLLYRDLQRINASCTVGIVARNLGRIPDIINKEFPGYIENGLLYMLITKRAIKKDGETSK